MRDVLVAGTIFLVIPFVLARPYIGVYLWTWISLMSPHRLAYGFAYSFPFAVVTAVAIFLGMMFSKEKKKIPWTRETVLLVVLFLWMVLTTVVAIHQDSAWAQLNKVSKIQLMILVTLILIDTQKKLHYLAWAIVVSLGFYGLKGGVFTILHGGAYHVQGPADSFIGGNNEVALALVMTIPLMRYLQLYEKNKWVRYGLAAWMLITVISAVGSQSRGALLALAAMGALIWLKGRKKLVTAVLLLVSVGMVVTIMPQSWFDRMGTIRSYEQDGSALGRINSWHFAYNLALSRPFTGGGFESFTRDLFLVYAPEPENVHDAHSIYFEMLGEHGFVGLGLYLLIWLLTWRTASKLSKQANKDPDTKWMADLLGMVQASMIGFAVGGAFLGLSYFDLYYLLIAFVIISKRIASEKLKVSSEKNGETILLR